MKDHDDNVTRWFAVTDENHAEMIEALQEFIVSLKSGRRRLLSVENRTDIEEVSPDPFTHPYDPNETKRFKEGYQTLTIISRPEDPQWSHVEGGCENGRKG